MKAGTKRNTGIGLAGAKGGDAAVAETLPQSQKRCRSRGNDAAVAEKIFLKRNLPVGAILGAAWLEAKQT